MKGDRPVRAFLWIAGLFGAILLLLTPPFQVADEYVHFYRAFQVSEGNFIAERQTGACSGYSKDFTNTLCLGGDLPESLLETARTVSSTDLRFQSDRKQDPQEAIALLDLPLVPQERVFIKFNTTGLHSPVPYLPQAIGIAIGRVLHLSPLILMYLGRTTNFAVWLLLCAAAIAVVPMQKWLWFLLAIAPMSLFQAASLSADALTNGIAFLLIGLILHYACDRDAYLRATDIAILAILSIALALCKLAYFPIVFLLFIIPTDKIRPPKRYYLTFGAIAFLSCFAIWLWSQAVSQIYVPILPGHDPNAQIEWMRSHPFEFIQIALQTYSEFIWQYLHEWVGVFGWLDAPLPVAYVVTYLTIALFFAVSSFRPHVYLSSQQKLFVGAIAFLTVGVLTSLAYLWNDVGAVRIAGIQGRYFIPIAPLIGMLLYQRRLQIGFDVLSRFARFYAIFSGTVAIATIVRRYYI